MIGSPLRKPFLSLSSSVGKMITNNLGKYFQPGTPTASSSSSSSLLLPCGGATGAPYFASLHNHHQRRLLHSSPSPLLSPNVNDQDQDRQKGTATVPQLSPELKGRLDGLKDKLSLAKNEYYQKYQDKFQQLEMTSPRELLAKLEALDKRLTVADKQAQQMIEQSTKSKSNKEHFVLNDVMALDRIKDMEREDIIFLWQEFHRKKEGLLAAVMAGSVFDKMTELASQYPMFLMPLPRENGYEFLFVQYMNKAFHFTPLLAYQVHKENAPECLRLISYADLQGSKDLVLMRGEFDKNLLGAKDAHFLAVQVNFYYGETSESRRKLLEKFSNTPNSFQHLDLIDELKKLQESHPHLFEFEE